MMRALFSSDPARHDGIPLANIYLMRVLYALMAVVLGKDVWTHILAHDAPWQPQEAMAWCVWAAFASLAVLGLFHTARMLPILLLEVFYKVLWLGLVAYPLWRTGQLGGSEAEGMTGGFVWVLLPIVAIPWPYVVRTYFLGAGKRVPAGAAFQPLQPPQP